MGVQIAVLADVQRPAQDELTALRRAVEEVNQKKPDLTVFCGDLVDQPDSQKEYDNVLPVMGQIESELRYVIGNHDADPDQSDYAALFRNRIGLDRTYYSFDFSGYHFIILDTTLIKTGKVGHFGAVSQDQLVWLKQDLLAKTPDNPIIIFSHNPLLATDRFGVVNAGEVFELTRRYNVIAAFAAHKHYNEQKNEEGVPIIVTGPLSFGLNGQKTLGYRWVELDGTKLAHHWIPVMESPSS